MDLIFVEGPLSKDTSEAIFVKVDLIFVEGPLSKDTARQSRLKWT